MPAFHFFFWSLQQLSCHHFPSSTLMLFCRTPSIPVPLVTRQEARCRATLGLLPVSISPAVPVEPTTVVDNIPDLHINTDSDSSELFEFQYPYALPPILSPFEYVNHHHNNPMPPILETMAEVKFMKMKECPMLTAGKIMPLSHQAWSLVCKCYLKHGGKTAAEVVSFVAEGMMEPWLIQWYQADKVWIDALTLDLYLEELAALTLDKNWAHTLHEEILNSQQRDHPFIDWKIEVENLNAILTTLVPTRALSTPGIKDQLEAELHLDLHLSLTNEPILTTSLAPWSIKVKERDDCLKFKEMRTQHIFECNSTSISATHFVKKSLASHLMDPPTSNPNSPHNSPAPAAASSSTTTCSATLPKLTEVERTLLNEYIGCTCWWTFHAGHRSSNCPMTATNTWPNAATYKLLTLPMAHTAASLIAGAVLADIPTVMEEERDYDTSDLYMHKPTPFTVSHLYASLEISGPCTKDFPLPIKALLDVGCPSTVISDALASQLSLCWFPLLVEEDNLSSLSNSPLHCSEYVKLEVLSGRGFWNSGVHQAKVNVGLPVPLILGMPFLSSKHIVINTNSHTAIDKWVKYDLISTRIPECTWVPDRVTPPPTPKKLPRKVRITSRMLLCHPWMVTFFPHR